MPQRYSIVNCDENTLASMGARNVKSFTRTGVIFADLEEPQLSALRSMGCSVLLVERVHHTPLNGVDGGSGNGVTPQDVIAPVRPINRNQVFTPMQLLAMAGLGVLNKYTGKGINIAVMDTGIRSTHQALGAKVVFNKNYTQDKDDSDGFDHGTGVASIIHIAVPDASILNFKVMDHNGDGSTEELIEAIDDAIQMQESQPEIAPAVINISAGTPDTGDPNDPLRVACRAAIANSIWISAAVGNTGPNPGTVMSPACERYVFGTGSISSFPPYKISQFSSRGPSEEGITKPDAVFFGESVVVASSRDDAAEDIKSGTSISAPFATGVAAKYLEAMASGGKGVIDEELGKIISPVSAEQLLDGGLGPLCVKPEITPTIKDNSYGFGIPDGKLIAQSLSGSQAIQDQLARVETLALPDPSDLITTTIFAMIMKVIISFGKTKV